MTMNFRNVQSWIAASVALCVVGSAPAVKAEEGLLDFDLQGDDTAIAAGSQTVESIPKSDAAPQHPVLGEAIASADRSLEVSFELAALEAAVNPWQDPIAVIPTVPNALDPNALDPNALARSPGLSQSDAQSKLQSNRQSNPQSNAQLSSQSDLAESFFQGGSDSLVAKAVGNAEGTRTPEGGKTRAYYGHIDPGNGVWNLGSFSYQHGAKTPEEADEKQLQRLQRQAQELRHQAMQKGITMTLEEELNGIDLANQSPAAALDRGYVPWLTTARNLGLAGSEAVLWARTRSYLDPDSGQWSAPGLGNTLHSITHDQERRMNAVNRAIALHQQRLLDASERVAHDSTPTNDAMHSTSPIGVIADQIIFQDVLEK